MCEVNFLLTDSEKKAMTFFLFHYLNLIKDLKQLNCYLEWMIVIQIVLHLDLILPNLVSMFYHGMYTNWST